MLVNKACCFDIANQAPNTWPSSIATKLPISTMPLPPINSGSVKCCGKYAYFTGPNNVECIPIINKAAPSSQMLLRKKPALANTMIQISKTLTMRISLDFSNLSAICPAVAENKKNGKINKPGSKVVSVTPLMFVKLAA